MVSPVTNLDEYRNTLKTETRERALKFGDGDGTSGGMDVLDAKIAAAEARTDTKFAALTGKLDLMNSRLDGIKDATSGLSFNTWLAAGSAVGVVLAAMAIGVSQFGNGVMVTTAAVNDAAEAKRVSLQNAEDLKKVADDLARLVTYVTTNQPTDRSAPNEPTLPPQGGSGGLQIQPTPFEPVQPKASD